jgi:hypothetical protein
MTNTINVYAFVAHADSKHINQNIIANPEEYLKSVFNGGTHSQLYNIQSTGSAKIMGFIYDFKPYLKRFWYSQYDSINQAYAPNKATLRKSVYGKIDKIVEVN